MRRTTGVLTAIVSVVFSAGVRVAVASPAYAGHNHVGNGSGNRNALCERQRICVVHQTGWNP